MKYLAILSMTALLLTSCGGNKTADKAEAADTEATEAVTEASDTDPAALTPGAVPVGIVNLEDDNLLRPATRLDYPVIIDFNATWCGPCKMFAPAFEAAANEYSGQAAFVEVDIDRCPKTAEAFGVQSIPQLTILMPDGTLKSYVGTEDLLDQADPSSAKKFINLLAAYIKPAK